MSTRAQLGASSRPWHFAYICFGRKATPVLSDQGWLPTGSSASKGRALLSSRPYINRGLDFVFFLLKTLEEDEG